MRQCSCQSARCSIGPPHRQAFSDEGLDGVLGGGSLERRDNLVPSDIMRFTLLLVVVVMNVQRW